MKKIIAPLLITILVGIFIFLYGAGFVIVIASIGTVVSTIAAVLISLCFITILAALIYTLYTRIKEIQKEDSDDLSKY